MDTLENKTISLLSIILFQKKEISSTFIIPRNDSTLSLSRSFASHLSYQKSKRMYLRLLRIGHNLCQGLVTLVNATLLERRKNSLPPGFVHIFEPWRLNLLNGTRSAMGTVGISRCCVLTSLPSNLELIRCKSNWTAWMFRTQMPVMTTA